MESLRLEEENILKDITNLFRQEKEQNYTSQTYEKSFYTKKRKLKQLKIEY